MKIKYQPIEARKRIELPSSKSISNRYLILQALYHHSFQIKQLSDSHDTLLLKNLLEKIKTHASNDILVLDCEDAGTTFRFLIAFCALSENKKFKLTGTSHLLQRPINGLIEALKKLGATIEMNGKKEILVTGTKLFSQDIIVEEEQTSQFISSLCLIAPTLNHGLKIRLHQNTVSESYIQMTLQVLSNLGISCTYIQNQIIILPYKYLQQTTVTIEPDWSSACFFYTMKMLNPALNITFKNCSLQSVQGDSYIIKLASLFGVISLEQEKRVVLHYEENKINIPLELNLSSYPDLAIPFIVVCAVKFPNIKLTGLKSLKYKESHRLKALKTELGKFGLTMNYRAGVVSFIPSKLVLKNAILQVRTYNDHRIAMSMSMLCLLGYTIQLDNALCVKKSFPQYWNEVQKLGLIEHI